MFRTGTGIQWIDRNCCVRDTATLADYLDYQLNNKPLHTRVMLTDARIARQTALQRWIARDWPGYHRAYYS